MSLSRSPWDGPAPPKPPSPLVDFAVNALFVAVFALIFYCCCRNCIHATIDIVSCLLRCCCCCCCRGGAKEESEEGGKYAPLDEEQASLTPPQIAVASSPERAAASDALDRMKILSKKTPPSPPGVGDAAAAAAAPPTALHATLPIAEPIDARAHAYADQMAIPVAPFAPPRATVLNPQGHYHPQQQQRYPRRSCAPPTRAMLECGGALALLLLLGLAWWYIECESSHHSYSHRSCSIFDDGHGHGMHGVHPPNYYVQHLLDNSHVVRGPVANAPPPRPVY